MSAFICGKDHFIVLGLFAASRQGGYGRGHIAVDPKYIDGLSPEAQQLRGVDLAAYYANILYLENVRSVHARYPQDAENTPETITIPSYATLQASYKLPAVSILKMADCLEYQSCETEDYRTTLAWELLSHIRKAAWRTLPGYEDTPWEYITPERRAAWKAEDDARRKSEAITA